MDEQAYEVKEFVFPVEVTPIYADRREAKTVKYLWVLKLAKINNTYFGSAICRDANSKEWSDLETKSEEEAIKKLREHCKNNSTVI